VIISVPAMVPVTSPVPEPIVAIPVPSVLHVPPVVASCKVTGDPVHTTEGPVIAADRGFTVTVIVAMHVVGNT
jgi:hypothetical protein